MDDKIFTITAEPAFTRFVYLKTALIIVGVVQLLNLSAQWQMPQLINWKISGIVSAVLSVLMLYALTRTPLTKSLTIDYGKHLVTIGFMTLTKADNSLEISFERLGIKTDASFGTTAYGSKWKTSVLLDGKEVYLLLSQESGFTEAQMNEFNERVKECVKT